MKKLVLVMLLIGVAFPAYAEGITIGDYRKEPNDRMLNTYAYGVAVGDHTSAWAIHFKYREKGITPVGKWCGKKISPMPPYEAYIREFNKFLLAENPLVAVLGDAASLPAAIMLFNRRHMKC